MEFIMNILITNTLFSSYAFFPCEKILTLKRLKEKGDNSTAIIGEALLALFLTGLIVSNILQFTQIFKIFPEVTTRESKTESQLLVKNG